MTALLHRDLRGGRRGTATTTARALAILLSAAGAVSAYAAFRPGEAEQLATVCGCWLFGSLMGVSLVMAPAIAAFALRAEREAGTLDLLRLAGIGAPTLVVGRTLSSFSLLANLLLAALPALALLTFFRAPPVEGLAAATILLASHFLAVAAVGVAVSAWSGSAGMALALSFLVFGSWAAMLVFGVNSPESTSSGVLFEALGMPLLRGEATDGPNWSSVAVVVAVHLALAHVAAVAAAAGLRKVAARATRDRLRERLDGWLAARRGEGSVDDRWPLTWLAARTSAPSRPSVQAWLVVPIAGVAAAAGAEVSAIVGSGLLLTAYFAGLGLGATAVAHARETRTWESLLTTSLSGRAILADFAVRAMRGSVVPLLAGLGLLALAHGRLAGALELSSMAAATAAVVAGWLVAIAAALCGSLVARSIGSAMAIALGFLLAEPAIGLACGELVSGTRTFDIAGVVSWLVLLGDAAFLSAWLLLRARWRRVTLVILSLLPTFAVLLVPFLIWSDTEAYRLAPSVIGAGAGLALVAVGMRSLRGVAAVSGALLILACAVLPFLVSTGGVGSDAQWLFPWAAWPGQAIAASFEQVAPVGDVGVAFLHSLLVLAALALVVLPRLERWLGRAG